jgi:hypothetical protein
MMELFKEFVKSPSRSTYLAVFQAVSSSDIYSPYSNEMSSIEGLVDQGRYEDARASLSESMPNLLLSPRAHLLMGFIAKKRGDEKGSEMERYLASSCAKGIVATGEGSRANPYVVLRTSDEYDVVKYLGTANHKWFRNLAVARIVVEYLESMNMQYPKPKVDIANIRREYHAAKQP